MHYNVVHEDGSLQLRLSAERKVELEAEARRERTFVVCSTG